MVVFYMLTAFNLGIFLTFLTAISFNNSRRHQIYVIYMYLMDKKIPNGTSILSWYMFILLFSFFSQKPAAMEQVFVSGMVELPSLVGMTQGLCVKTKTEIWLL